MSVRSLARELGVSPTAVSLALQNSPRVSVALREKAQRLARERGHTPNARLALVMSEVRRSAEAAYRGTLGVISLFPEEKPWVERPLFSHLKRYRDGAAQRARMHGYRLEDFWVKRPGLSADRLRTILQTRGVSGLLCLGSLDPEERLPAELREFAVVTHAASIPDRLNRVLSHFAADARTLFEQLLRRGYRRPGLNILVSGDRRTDHLYSASFLSHQERWFAAPAVPILRAETWDAPSFDAWFDAHRPDVLVVHQHEDYLARMVKRLAGRGLRVPRDVGLALLDKIPDFERYAGITQDHGHMGAVAVEMLIGRLLLGDVGPPEFPKIELVEGRWNEGRTLRPAK